MIDVNIKGLLYTTHAAPPHPSRRRTIHPAAWRMWSTSSSVAGRVASAGAGSTT